MERIIWIDRMIWRGREKGEICKGERIDDRESWEEEEEEALRKIAIVIDWNSCVLRDGCEHTH